MMQREALITLEADEREDGTVYVYSPNVPLFHVVAPDVDDWIDWVEPILKRHLELNLGKPVELRRVPNWNETMDISIQSKLPAHIIAEMVQ